MSLDIVFDKSKIVRKSNFPTMQTQLVRIKTKYQVTLPLSIQRAAKLRIGDLLEAKVEKGKVTLVPKRVVDKHKAFIDAHIAKGLADIEEGRGYGPFDTAEEAIAFLQASARKYKEKLRKRS